MTYEGLMRALVWLIYAGVFFFVFAYVAMWGLFAPGVAWAVGVGVAGAAAWAAFRALRARGL